MIDDGLSLSTCAAILFVAQHSDDTPVKMLFLSLIKKQTTTVDLNDELYLYIFSRRVGRQT
jgi:hypothetical protein